MDLTSYLADLSSYTIGQFGMQVLIYHPVDVTLRDGNTVPDEVVFVDKSTASFQFGREAQAQAMAMGLLDISIALVKFPASTEPILCLRAILVDDKKRVWILRSPAATTEMKDTISLMYLASEIDAGNLPDGIKL